MYAAYDVSSKALSRSAVSTMPDFAEEELALVPLSLETAELVQLSALPIT